MNIGAAVWKFFSHDFFMRTPPTEESGRCKMEIKKEDLAKWIADNFEMEGIIILFFDQHYYGYSSHGTTEEIDENLKNIGDAIVDNIEFEGAEKENSQKLWTPESKIIKPE